MSALAIAAATAPAGFAQTASRTDARVAVDVWGGVAVAWDGPAGSVSTSFPPPLLLDGAFTSQAGQTLTVRSGRSPGVVAGGDVLVNAVGFGVIFERTAYDLSGANGPYASSLTYTSIQPPNNQSQLVTAAHSVVWPDTSGTLTQRMLAFNAVARFALSTRADLVLSGGPAWLQFGGTVGPIGYTAFQLGGHSVLFEDGYRLQATIGETNAIGYDAGAQLGIAIARGLRIVAGYRYVGGPHAQAALTPARVLNPDAITFAQTIDEIRTRLNLPPLTFSTASSRLFVGLRAGR